MVTHRRDGAPENGQDKSLLTFPCDFTVKVVGRNDTRFEKMVIALVRRHFPNVVASNYKKRLSRDANFLALNLTVHAKSKKQLDDLYRELSASEVVIMAL